MVLLPMLPDARHEKSGVYHAPQGPGLRGWLRRVGLGTVGIAASAVAYYHFAVQPDPIKTRYADKRAKVQCKCGAAELEFRNYECLGRVECCCFDCRQRQEWVHARGAPVPPYTKPFDAKFVHNAVTGVKGEHLLKPYALRAATWTNPGCTFLVSECCSSLLALVHPSYLGNVAAISDSCADTETSCCQSQARINTKDWDEDKVGSDLPRQPLPPYTGAGPELDFRSVGSLLDLLFRQGHLRTLLSKPLREEGDRSVQDIVASCGPTTVIGVPEYQHIAGYNPSAVNIHFSIQPLQEDGKAASSATRGWSWLPSFLLKRGHQE